MPKANRTSHSRGIRRIAIDGHFLDEIQTRLQTEGGEDWSDRDDSETEGDRERPGLGGRWGHSGGRRVAARGEWKDLAHIMREGV
jgi:hypothetical protein